MLIIQIILLAVVVLALLRGWLQFKRGVSSATRTIVWSVFWLLVGVVVVLPETTQLLANVVGVGRGVDLAIYLALLALFFLVFKLFTKIELLEREISKLVRTIALKKEDKQE